MTERAQCTAPLQYGNAVPPGGAGGGDARDAGIRGPRTRGRARVRRGREKRRMQRGRELQRHRDETHPEGAQAGREKQAEAAGGGELGAGRGRRKEGGAEMDRGEKRLETEDRQSRDCAPGSGTPRQRSGERTRQKNTSSIKGGPQGRDLQGQDSRDAGWRSRSGPGFGDSLRWGSGLLAWPASPRVRPSLACVWCLF